MVQLVEPLDQATGLRRLFSAEPAFHAVGVLGPDPRRNARASLAIAQGLSRRGDRVLILDEDRPPYNVGSTLGLLARRSLADLPQRRPMDAVIPAGESIKLLSAQEGVNLLAAWSEQDLLEMTDDWRDDEPEWMILNGRSVRDGTTLAQTAGIKVLVLPGAKTHLANSYAILKAACQAWAGGNWWVLVEGVEPDAAQPLFTSLRETAERFLGVVPGYLGTLPRLRGSGSQSVADPALQGLLAETLSATPAAEMVSFGQYWQRMWLFSRMSAESANKKNRKC